MKYNLNDEGHDSAFESFSDMILNVCVVLIALITVLALNVGERLDRIISPNHFSGGVTRPKLYLEATKVDYSQTKTERYLQERNIFSNNEIIEMYLWSPSTAKAHTTVVNGKTILLVEGETFHGRYELDAYNFLKLACGIDPGYFKVGGQDTALLDPESSQTRIVYENEYMVMPDANLARKILSIVWPVFLNPQYPVRSHNEYQGIRTKIYVETWKDKSFNMVVIGQSSFTIPDDVKDGTLAWLLGFSSGLTEIHYLGEYWSDDINRTNKRIDFFEKKGFIDCANAYRYDLYPKISMKEQESLFSFLCPWESLSSEEKKEWTIDRTNGEAKEYYERIRQIENQSNLNLLKISPIIVNEERPNIPREYLPPLVAYPEAWRAYIDYYDKEEKTPPQWFFDDFLKPLGFDRRVVRGNDG